MSSPVSQPVIALQDVALTLRGNAGPVNILSGVTLEVARGETLGLIGPSGSGKSSLLMLMGGLEAATSGRVTVLGQDLTAWARTRWPASAAITWAWSSSPSTSSRR